MIGLISILIKIAVAVVLLYSVMTRQELHFNPLGRAASSVLDPVFTKSLKMTKKQSDRLTPLIILGFTILQGFIFLGVTGRSLTYTMAYSFDDMLKFLLLFYFIALLVGSTVNRFGVSAYSTFFYRLALPWVKTARTFFKTPGNLIIIPSMLLLFAAFLVLDSLVQLSFYFAQSGNVMIEESVRAAVSGGLVSLAQMLQIYVWLIIFRALMSWVSPDPANPVVQFIGSVTDPIMEPFRKIIPPLGMIDISPIILIMVIYFLREMLMRLAHLV
ncbi:YggT family protein [Limisalsivibrio acetivorans]|uniref:YggT family protein n=1 Tax=Limisalsivibrio acetivorans TaxID=1304888 RepID=UPI0003B3903B|nr:YggT family protein [Limisalsivibrio acetivorans]